MRCTLTTMKGTRCRWPALGLVGGIATCQYHEREAARWFADTRAQLGQDHPIVLAAERDTRERNR